MKEQGGFDGRDAGVSLELDLEEGDAVQQMFGRESGLFVVTTRKILRLRSPNYLDPKREHHDVPWEQSLYLPHGSSDYIVARTILQTHRIAGIFFSHGSPKLTEIMDVSWEVMSSLISLRFIHDRLKRQIDDITSKTEENWELYTAGQNPRPLPIVNYYDIEFRSFVNEVRRTLSKISELFAILTPKEFSSGHFHKALEWIKEVRGKDSELAAMLERDLRWISAWIDIRISIEHPTKDRFIETLNFALEPNRTVRLPTWRFVHPSHDMARPQNLLDVFGFCIQNLLKFFEDLQVMLTDGHQPPGMGVEFFVVDEDKRDPLMPMRWTFRVYRQLGVPR